MIGLLALLANLFGKVPVLIPSGMVELDEADTALGQAAGKQAIRGKGAGLLRVWAVEIFRFLSFIRNIGRVAG